MLSGELPKGFKDVAISGVRVHVNENLLDSKLIPAKARRLIDTEMVFREAGEDPNSLREVFANLDSLNPITSMVTVVGSDWPTFWAGQGEIEQVVGVDINELQVRHYLNGLTQLAESPTADRLYTNVLQQFRAGKFELYVDDLTSPDEGWAARILPNSSIFLSNMPDYQHKTDFLETLRLLISHMSAHSYIIMSCKENFVPEHGETKRGAEIRAMVSELNQTLNTPVLLMDNAHFGLPLPLGAGSIDGFYVLEVLEGKGDDTQVDFA